MNNPVIKIESISKEFRIFHDRPLTFQLACYNFINKRKQYQDILALDKISLSLDRSETVGLIGANASGKSTLLRIIAGIYAPTSGRLKTSGRVVVCLELGSGFSGEFTGLENIYFYGAVFGLLRRQIRNKVNGIREFSELDNFLDVPVRQYSFGMRMRLAFAIAVNLDPDILLIDETLAVGDLYFKEKCYRKIEQLKNNGKTMILVSQHMDEIARLCGKAILLEKGRLINIGKPSEIIEEYKSLMEMNR